MLILQPEKLFLSTLRRLWEQKISIKLDKRFYSRINQSRKVINDVIKNKHSIYGINTGFGSLAQTRIEKNQLQELQRKIVLSHAAGVGKNFSNEIVKMILLLKIISLSRGYSGVRPIVIDTLIQLFNHEVYPCIPEKGSVGASGDLAPLAHLSLALIGEGEVSFQNKIMPTKVALKKINLKPIQLEAKEGLALLNGTQVSTALALIHLFQAQNLFSIATLSGCLTLDAAMGSIVPFDDRIQKVRGNQGQIIFANAVRNILLDSKILKSHQQCEKVQDPYCLRCQPQVMGAIWTHFNFAAEQLIIEANGVSDNPLVFAHENEILSGGNFHAEPIALIADMLAVAIAEIGSIAERRITLLTDKNFSNGLPAFLVKHAGINSGFMLAQVTAAALASENKTHAHPASVDSIPTSANQEDHVSMATFAARRLETINENVSHILAIELLAAAQAIDFRAPIKTSKRLQKLHQAIREKIPHYDEDRFFAKDIDTMKKIMQDKKLFLDVYHMLFK